MEERISFGVHRFDLRTGQLFSGPKEIRLTPKASAVLKNLVMHAGQLVSKNDLFASVWTDTIVSDDALTSCIQELRKALADDPRQPRFIETRHRVGYRFVAPLSEIPAGDLTDAGRPEHGTSAIAVLPFADMSPGRDQDYFCEGLAEELINALTRVDGLRVAAPTASFQCCGRDADVRAIGRHLGVGALLEGSVRKAENRLRVTVKLIDVATGYHRWSRHFDRALDDVLAIQDEIAATIATSLRGSVLRRHETPMPRQPIGVMAHDAPHADGTTFMTRPDLQRGAASPCAADQCDRGLRGAHPALC